MANSDWKKELKKICTILKEQKIDILKLAMSGIVDGKRQFLTLKDMNIEGIDKIISENNLNPNFEFGKFVNRFRLAYNETIGKLSEEERQFGEELGIVKNNIGKRSPRLKRIDNIHVRKISKSKKFTYVRRTKKPKEFIDKVINEALPKILIGDTAFVELENEFGTSYATIDRIICDYYAQTGDNDGLEQYKEAKKNRSMQTIMQRAKERREEIEQYSIVTNVEFLALSPDEQNSQLIKKIRLERLKENKKNSKAVLLTEETTKKMVEKTMKYFRNKNTKENEFFSDDDIRYMIYRYPSLINRSTETLDEKFETFTSYEGIDELDAYGMVKTAPMILGYNSSRIKKQLDLLEKNGIIDVVFSKPSLLMVSPSLMHALIEYAKERYSTSDLSDIKLNSIFVANSTLKRAYGITADELKERYPYEVQEPDLGYVISGEDLGKTKTSLPAIMEASKVINTVVKNLKCDKKMGVGDDGSI